MSFKEKLCYLTWGDPHRWMPTAGRGHTERPGTRSGPHHDRGRLLLYEIVVYREGTKLAMVKFYWSETVSHMR